MSAIHFSIDVGLVRVLRDSLRLDTFVETGTYQGESVRRVRDLFARIYTVDHAPALAEKARQAFAGVPHIEVACAESPAFLAALAPRLADTPTLYWLDAHWCAKEGVTEQERQCPLLDELAGIGALNERSAILIDDAWLFLGPPPARLELLNWPRLHQILAQLGELSSKHRVTVLNDAILFYPPMAAEAVEDYASRNGLDFLEAMNHLRKGGRLKLIAQLLAKQAMIQKLTVEVAQLRKATSRRQAGSAAPGGATR